MADIFVGSVSVGVVPDARGWQRSLQAQLVPSSQLVGQQVGNNISSGIVQSLGSNKTRMAKAGAENAGAFSEGFKKRLEAALKTLPDVKIDADSSKADRRIAELRARMTEILSKEIGVDLSGKEAMAEIGKIDAGLKILSKDADIRVRFDAKSARAEIAKLKSDISGTAGQRGGILGSLQNIIPGMGGVGGAAGQAAGGGGGFGGFGLTNPYVLGGGAAALAGILPFAGQALAGTIVGGLGTGLAGIGAAGAFGLGTTPANPAQMMAAQLAVTKAQDTLNKLRASGKTTTTQLAVAQSQLAISQAKLTALQKANINETTKGQQQVRQAFSNLKTNAIADLTKIGAAFVPVMTNIANTASKVLGKMTPVFSGAIRIIAGPVEKFVDTVLNAFARPAVVKSIQDVANAFVKILNAFAPDIPGIADSLAQSISRMADAVAKNPKAMADFLNFLFQIPIAIFDALAWLANLATWIETHWGPLWKKVRKPATDAMKFIVSDIKGFADLVIGIFKILIDIITFHWGNLWRDLKNLTRQEWNNLRNMFHDGLSLIGDLFHNQWHSILNFLHIIWNDIRSLSENVWNSIWNNTIGRAIRGGHDLEVIFNDVKARVIQYWHDVQSGSENIWNSIWNNTIGRAIRGWHDLMNVFTRLKSDVINWFHDAANWLTSAGSNIISGLYNGILSAIKGVGSWINNNVVQPVVNAVKHFFGIASPSTVMIGIGKAITAGLLHGIFSAGDLKNFVGKVFGGWPQALGALVNKSLVNIAKLPQKALQALGSFAGKVGSKISGFFSKVFGGGGGSGVQRWAGVVAQALSMLGLPLSLAGQVLYQMQTESGGDPNAINLTDINAQMGDPSRGLLQTIMSTFMAYHVPGTSMNIYDPLANVAAAINYARARYGPTLMSGGMGMGSGHGYDTGGWLPTGLSMAYNGTGSPELIVPQKQLSVAGGTHYHAHFDGLTGQAIEGYVQGAFAAMNIREGHLARVGRRQ